MRHTRNKKTRSSTVDVAIAISLVIVMAAVIAFIVRYRG